MLDLSEGSRLDHYELDELLARSGMASIFKAVDTNTGATVVLKIPHLHFECDVVFSERFRREETIGLRLEHPNLVKLFPTGKRSRVYLAMEFVEGRSLRAILDADKPLAVERALNIAKQMGEALVYLHDHKVVHRDLKPENILVTQAGVVKILDFGIALDESARRLTWFGLSSTIGTPDYMAPEQAQGRRGDARADIYALGTILYEMLLGELPFVGGSAQAILSAKTHDEPRPPHQIKPELDPKLEDIVLHAIERLPRKRYAHAADLLRDLQEPARVVPRDPTDTARNGPGRLWGPRGWFPMVVSAIVLGLLALMWMTQHQASDRMEPTAQSVEDAPR